MSTRLRVGVIGCGLIAQVMHLPHLRDLSDRFEIAALCDRDAGLLATVADRFGVHERYTEWQDLLAKAPLDAVLILTSGDHAPMIVAAAGAGLHILVEKPISHSTEQATAALAAVERAGVRLMVGYMKRFDPAYVRLAELVGAQRRDLRSVQVTTLESLGSPYVAHHGLVAPSPL